jgi:N-methylhydantoinase A
VTGQPRLRIGIDTGGTFTDVVVFDRDTGRWVSTKTPSTPDEPSRGFMEGVDKGLHLVGLRRAGVEGVVHGTTVATNALLQEDFSGLGFITTHGFRHVLEIARQSVPDGYGNSYFWVKPDRIVPLHLVREVPERLDHTGAVLHPFDEEGAAAAARWFRGRGVTALGVCFLHAYANPDHERRMRDVLARELPGVAVSISSDVLREYREYERSVTTLVDAFVKPKVAAYLAGIADRLGDTPFAIMQSNGGVLSAAEVGTQPITTILSGPAAGALGAAMIADVAGYDQVLTLDGGGTSTDVCVVRGGEPAITTEGTVGRFPVKIPMVDIVTVGTGGGSIAWVPAEGGLKVGPRSAGASPGPMCYGQGGDEPTITDAALLLGRIPPYLLGGEIPLDVDAARVGYERLAGAVGLDVEEAAAGVMEIAAWNQANAIRQVTVRRGLDVREFVMATFGGSGPLQACRLIDILGVPRVLVPPDPGNVSAFGLLTVDVRTDYVRTRVARHDGLDLDDVTALYADLEAHAADALRREGFDDPARHVYARSADLRYFGQAFEVGVPAPAGTVDKDFAEQVLAAFHDEHERLYGYCYRDDPSKVVEWVNYRVTGIGPIQAPEIPEVEAADGDTSAALIGQRKIYVGEAWQEAARFDRARLRAADVVTGPAIVEEFGSTVPIAPGFAATVDRYANLMVEKR